MQASINITPLVDVVLVLLIIFMVMAPSMRKGPELTLPNTAQPVDQGDERLTILVTIDPEGKLWVDDKQVEPEFFGDTLRAAAGADKELRVVVRGDARLNVGEVRRTMLAIEDAGFQGVGLIAKKTGGAKAGGN
jgi:biopolymer transport protein ExbD/biopolymer transport protein TolR